MSTDPGWRLFQVKKCGLQNVSMVGKRLGWWENA